MEPKEGDPIRSWQRWLHLLSIQAKHFCLTMQWHIQKIPLRETLFFFLWCFRKKKKKKKEGGENCSLIDTKREICRPLNHECFTGSAPCVLYSPPASQLPQMNPQLGSFIRVNLFAQILVPSPSNYLTNEKSFLCVCLAQNRRKSSLILTVDHYVIHKLCMTHHLSSETSHLILNFF